MIKHSKKAMNMLKKFNLLWFIVITMISTPYSISAQEYKALTHKSVMTDVIKFVEEQVDAQNKSNVRVTALPLDSRIKLHVCDEDLKFALANKRSFTRQFPVKVSCEVGVKPWKTYVQVIVSEMLETLVVTKNIAKGARIEADMLELKLIDKHRVKSRSINSSKDIIGGRAMRNISRGYQIGQRDVCLVCKGDDVSIIAKSGGMMIKTSGTAIENGAKGETIRVKNASSSRIIKGVIGDLREIYVNL